MGSRGAAASPAIGPAACDSLSSARPGCEWKAQSLRTPRARSLPCAGGHSFTDPLRHMWNNKTSPRLDGAQTSPAQFCPRRGLLVFSCARAPAETLEGALIFWFLNSVPVCLSHSLCFVNFVGGTCFDTLMRPEDLPVAGRRGETISKPRRLITLFPESRWPCIAANPCRPALCCLPATSSPIPSVKPAAH